MAKETPRTIDKYRILSPLKEGGMGSLFLARHPTLKQNVVLKKLTLRGKEVRERFEREARILMDLRHENIVTVYDHFKEGRNYYIVFELVEGISLEEYLHTRGCFKPRTAGKVINRVASALDYIHSKGVIHRDIKPANIMLSSQGQIKLADFGIAGLEEQDALDEGEPRIMGTPGYMSPEQLDGSCFAGRPSDIFSLGITFIHLLTGEIPAGDSDLEEVKKKYSRTGLGNRELLKGLPFGSLIRSMVRISPRRRPSARSVANRLQPLIDRQQGHFFKRHLGKIIPASLALVLFFVLMLFRDPLLKAFHPPWLIPFQIVVQYDSDTLPESSPEVFWGRGVSVRRQTLPMDYIPGSGWETPVLYRRKGEALFSVEWGSYKQAVYSSLEAGESEGKEPLVIRFSPPAPVSQPLRVDILLLDSSTGGPVTGVSEIYDPQSASWLLLNRGQNLYKSGKPLKLRFSSPGYKSRTVVWTSEIQQVKGRMVITLDPE